MRWYPRYALSYRDAEELLVERSINVDYVTTYRWVQRFTPLLIMVHRHDAGLVTQAGHSISLSGLCLDTVLPAATHPSRQGVDL